MPANGWAMPQMMFCNAMARPNTSRPQSFAWDCGFRNRPSTARGPKLNSDTRHPQSTITAGERQLLERSEAKGREAVLRSEDPGCGEGIWAFARLHPNEICRRPPVMGAWQPFAERAC